MAATIIPVAAAASSSSYRPSMSLYIIAMSFISAQAKAFTSSVPSLLVTTQSLMLHHGSSSSISPHAASSISTATMAAPLQAMPTGAAAVSTAASVGLSVVRSLRGGEAGEVSDLVTGAYEWCVNLGAPSALVAGAVVATLYENIGNGDLDVDKADKGWVKVSKRITRFLLLSAFALEVISLFVTTVTGTMLLSRPLPVMAKLAKVTSDTTPLSFLKENFEFEYLASRVTFLQGLLNWVVAIGFSHIIPQGGAKSAKRMGKFIAAMLCSTTILMVSFYNNHLTYYRSYEHMLWRLVRVTATRFLGVWPPRPMMMVFLLCQVPVVYYGYKAFTDDDDNEDDEDDK